MRTTAGSVRGAGVGCVVRRRCRVPWRGGVQGRRSLRNRLSTLFRPSTLTLPRTPHQTPALCTVLASLFFLSASANAQVAPNLRWRSLHTPHFHVHFSPGLEPVARRAAGSAERAYGRLAAELHEPRGPIDLVVGDNVDVSNGFTTPFPTNRITIYARPTVDATTLKFLDDWIDLVVTHELAHVFHLDRTRGWWRLGQYVFGRNPFLFPNQYTPAWLIEGIAVYYETKLTGAGRLAGTDHETIARAKSLDGESPALNALSLATPVFPLGNVAYAYGSLLMEEMARTQGVAKVRDFVEASSGRTIPFLLNTNARAGFGISFDSGWRRLSDSISRSALRVAGAAPAATVATASTGSTALRDVTARGWQTQRLRWTDAAHLLYSNNDGRDVSALREVAVAGGAPRYVERRNSLDVTSPLPDGSRVFAQQEFTDPYTIRTDLYLERAGSTTRLTRGERLMQPDARAGASPSDAGDATGALDVVAVQLAPGASRLVRVRVVGGAARIAPLTGAWPDTVWSEPRWSHAGTRIAATRWTYGGTSEIAILDTTGRVLLTVGRARAVNGSPSWARGDSAILFTSDRSGRSAIYRAWLPGGDLERVAEAATGLYEAEQSPDGSQIATLHYRGDGYRVALVPVPARVRFADLPSVALSVLPPSRGDSVVRSDAPATGYSAWRSLLPRYWLPAAGQSDQNRSMWGFITSGSDVVDRHSYQLTALYEPRRGEPDITFSYTYAGLGNPLLGLSGVEEWDHIPFTLVDSARNPVGTGILTRRKRFASASATLLRPRVRTNASLTIGAQMEWRDFGTDPAPLLAQLDPSFRKTYTYPTLWAGAGWSNVRAPWLAISAEDGIQLSASVAQRWRSDAVSQTRSTSVVGIAAAFKSLDFPGFAHHVLALRAAAAWADANATSEVEAGGVSGSVLTIAPGVTLGEGRRTFPVRGFAAGAQFGIRALGASVEYRAPLALPASGLGKLPLFFQKVNLTLFGDAAAAWCPSGLTASVICSTQGSPRTWMASAGAELHLDASYLYDFPYRFRLGAAAPVAGRSYFGKNSVAVYFAVGVPF